MRRSLIIFFVCLFLLPLKVHAEVRTEYEEIPLLYKARATAYCLENKTCTGKDVREGICASGDPRYIGQTIIMYQRLPDGSVGDIIGIYECEDSGCSSHVIDVWCEAEDCQSFMDTVYRDGCQGKIWIQILNAKG